MIEHTKKKKRKKVDYFTKAECSGSLIMLCCHPAFLSKPTVVVHRPPPPASLGPTQQRFKTTLSERLWLCFLLCTLFFLCTAVLPVPGLDGGDAVSKSMFEKWLSCFHKVEICQMILLPCVFGVKSTTGSLDMELS